MRDYTWQITTLARSWPPIPSSSGRELCGMVSPTNVTLKPRGGQRFQTSMVQHTRLEEFEDQPEQLLRRLFG